MTSGRIRVVRVEPGPLWAIRSSYFSPALIEHAKAVPGMSWHRESRSWQGYPDAVAGVVARLSTKGITVDDAHLLPDPDSWRSARTPFLFSTKDLRPYQVEGVRFLIARSREGALLADGMRLGKSLQSIIAARAFKQKTLVLCPSLAVGVWGRPKNAPEGPGEVAKWWPDAWKGTTDNSGKGVVCLESVKPFKAQDYVHKHQGRLEALSAAERKVFDSSLVELRAFADELEGAQVVICHFDIVYAWVEVLKLWGLATLIIDEAHLLSGYQSRRSEAVKELSRVSHQRMFLTGTPVTNTPKNLHNVLDALCEGRFGYFFIPPSEKKVVPGCFARCFCDSFQKTVGVGPEQKTVWDHTGRSNLDTPDGKWCLTQEETLHERLEFVMLRRLKKDVDPQLPQKVRQIIDVTIPARQIMGISDRMLRGDGKELRRCLDLAADGKLKSVVSLIETHIAEEEKVIHFCYRRLFAERVNEELEKKADDSTKLVFVHGGLTQKERDRRIHALRSHKGPGVLSGTIDTLGTSINLSFASVAVIGELTWDHHELEQLEERLYEYGVDSKILIQYVIARGTGDELVLRGVINKIDTADRLIGSTKSGLKEDLSHRKEDNMKRLYEALVEIQNAPLKLKKRAR